MKKTAFRISNQLLQNIHDDLNLPHKFAAERVGFICCRQGKVDGDTTLLLAGDYRRVDDNDYINDPHVGAMINSAAIRKALQFSFNNHAAMFHVHRHEHKGKPMFSPIDMREYQQFIPDFFKVQPKLPHGAIVLSQDSAFGAVWHPGATQLQAINEIWAIGTWTKKL